jgi:hypothetical protein
VRLYEHGGLASTGKAVDLKSTGPRGPWGFESLALRHFLSTYRALHFSSSWSTVRCLAISWLCPGFSIRGRDCGRAPLAWAFETLRTERGTDQAKDQLEGTSVASRIRRPNAIRATQLAAVTLRQDREIVSFCNDGTRRARARSRATARSPLPREIAVGRGRRSLSVTRSRTLPHLTRRARPSH